MCFKESITPRGRLPKSVLAQHAALPSLPSFISSSLNNDSSHLDIRGCVIINLLPKLCISFKEINKCKCKWQVTPVFAENLEATCPLCYMMVEWRESWGLTHASSSCGSFPCSDLLSVWAHIYLPIQVHPGGPQSSAGATWALVDVAVAAQEKAAPSWLPGHRHRVVMVWPHIVCSMPAAGFKSKHCLAVITKKKCSHCSAHIQWHLSCEFKGVHWVLNFGFNSFGLILGKTRWSLAPGL